ncbi:S1 family peptidase [Crenothrix sp.]|uniref:S1 family peptidase n=1 Tax=Crenothrix sp. TaxID=3100433 RepID=UPI00374D8E46
MYKSSLLPLTLLLSITATAQSSQNLSNSFLKNIPSSDWDAKMYSVSAGISIEEAKQRFKLTDKIGNLEEKLSREESDTFAGLWLEHKPKLRLVAQFAGGTKKDISTYMPEELMAISEVRAAKVSLAGLKKMRTKAITSFTNAGNIPIESDINVKENRVDLFVTNQFRMRGADILKKRNLQFPKNVKLITVSAPSIRQASFYGGLPLYQALPPICANTPSDPSCKANCTTGFSVINTLGIRGITTAGHCTDARKYSGIVFPYKAGSITGPYDIQWHTTPGYTPTNIIKVSNAGEIRIIIAAKPSSAQLIGELVCKYGVSTGYTCGYITTKTFIPANHTATFIRVDSSPPLSGYPVKNLSNSGDSGGPWFREGIAYGSHVGQPPDDGNDAYYMPINYVSGIGVSVLTIP